MDELRKAQEQIALLLEDRERMLGVLEELSIGVGLPKLFTVWKDGQVFAVEPDRIECIFETILEKFKRSQDWSLLTVCRNDNIQMWNMYKEQKDIAEKNKQ